MTVKFKLLNSCSDSFTVGLIRGQLHPRHCDHVVGAAIQTLRNNSAVKLILLGTMPCKTHPMGYQCIVPA